MAEFTIYDVYNALGLDAEDGTQTLINAIRNSSDFKGITSVYDGTVEGLQNFGVAVNRSTRHQNLFVNELVDRIGLTIINSKTLSNPLARFKKGILNYGRSIKEVFNDLIKSESYNPDNASRTLHARTAPNTRVLFYDTWRKELYASTIEEETLSEAFISETAFNNFVTGIYTAMYNSNSVDEYIWTKAMIESYVKNGFATYVQVPAVTDATTAKLFTKKTRATSTKMTLPQGSRKFNSMGVHTTTDRSNLWILIDADLQAELDVEVLANAFNMDKTTIERQMIIVENFALEGMQAVLFDADILKIYDKVFKMNSVPNEKGLYWNVFLHAHQLFGMGKFQNIVAFMSDNIPTITRLVTAPVIAYVHLGKKFTLEGYIELRNDVDIDDVTFTATAKDDSGNTLTGVTVKVTKSEMVGRFTVDVTASNETLVDTNIVITTTASTGADDTLFTRDSVAFVIPLPSVAV